MYQKVSGIEKFFASEVMSRFSVENFFLTVPNNFVEEPFGTVLQRFPVAKKFMDKREGSSVKTFRRKIFVSQCLKIL